MIWFHGIGFCSIRKGFTGSKMKNNLPKNNQIVMIQATKSIYTKTDWIYNRKIPNQHYDPLEIHYFYP